MWCNGMPPIVDPLSATADAVVKLMAMGWTPARCLPNAETTLLLLLVVLLVLPLFRTGVILSVLIVSVDRWWGGEADEQGDAVNEDAADMDDEDDVEEETLA